MSDLNAEQQAAASWLIDLIRNPANDMVWIEDLQAISARKVGEGEDWQPVAGLTFDSEESLRAVIESALVPLIHIGPKTEELWREPIEQRISAVIEVPDGEDGEPIFALLDVFWRSEHRQKPTMVLIVKHDADLYE